MAKDIDVEIGQVWRAKVSERMVDVKVDSVHPDDIYLIRNRRKRRTQYGLINLSTGRRLSGRTSAFLRRKVSDSEG